jgi:hypothetical protein
MPRRKKTAEEQYEPHMRRFMNWKDSREYAEGFVFSEAQCLEIRPNHIVRYMNLLAYGTEVPGPTDKPQNKRSSGLKFLKKSISKFMPNRNAAWNVESATGNPTMSIAVNDLIKKVHKAEVRKQGKKSNTKRDLKQAEFCLALRLLHEKQNDFLCHDRVPTMLKLQFHIIGRANDISNLETADLRSHEKFPSFALQLAVSWSKNVLDERSCPDKILLGAMDTDFCVLLALGSYLETFLSKRPQGTHRFLFGDSNQDDEPIRINERYQRVLRELWQHQQMKTLSAQVKGGLGSHSV